MCDMYSDCAFYGVYVLMKDIGRRLPFALASMHQDQQGDIETFSLELFNHSKYGSYKARFEGDKI